MSPFELVVAVFVGANAVFTALLVLRVDGLGAQKDARALARTAHDAHRAEQRRARDEREAAEAARSKRVESILLAMLTHLRHMDPQLAQGVRLHSLSNGI